MTQWWSWPWHLSLFTDLFISDELSYSELHISPKIISIIRRVLARPEHKNAFWVKRGSCFHANVASYMETGGNGKKVKLWKLNKFLKKHQQLLKGLFAQLGLLELLRKTRSCDHVQRVGPVRHKIII